MAPLVSKLRAELAELDRNMADLDRLRETELFRLLDSEDQQMVNIELSLKSAVRLVLASRLRRHGYMA